MRILVLSDTHGKYDALQRVLSLHPEAELIVHCGDGERELDLFLNAAPDWARRVYHVAGNCDATSRSPAQLTLALPYGHRLLAMHGHLLAYGEEMEQRLVAVANANQADLLLFGHTHCRMNRLVDGVRLLNPGSAAAPRDGQPPSYALLDLLPEGIVVSHADVPPPAYHMLHSAKP